VIPLLKIRIKDAVRHLEEQIAIGESDGTVSEEELKKAKEVALSATELVEKDGELAPEEKAEEKAEEGEEKV
jgi:hypothetical protein